MDIKIGNATIKVDVVATDDTFRIGTHRDPIVKKRFIEGFQKKIWKGGKPPNWNRDQMYYEAPINCRNLWHLDYFNAHAPDPYEQYRKPIIEFPMEPRYSKLKGKWYDPMPHQVAMASHVWTRRQAHIAAEMRTGKTLPVLTVCEKIGKPVWYVGPKSAIEGVKLEVFNWDIKCRIHFFTYAELTAMLKNFSERMKAPEVIVFDESHFIKGWDSQRTKAAFHITEEMRFSYELPWIVAMTGTPAPKNPCDIWAQLEVVQPGFLPETKPEELEAKIAIIEYKDNETGGQYPHRIAWRNSEHICYDCGEIAEKHYPWEHEFKPGINEVKRLGERIRGISIKFLKKDCIKLPDKIYDRMKLKPSRTVLKYSAQIKKSGQSPAVILNELAQLSAGFYYKMEDDTTKLVACEQCTGEKLVEDVNGDLTRECPRCSGTGKMHPRIRVAIQVDCPKDEALIDILEECEPSARCVVFAGFIGAIDRIHELCRKHGWTVIQIDGRGWEHTFDNNTEALRAFSNIEEFPDKIVVVAHPSTGGTGVSYSSSSTIVYWHNPFDGAARMQSMERGSDLGMDMTRGCKIIDLVQLPVDEYILDNLDGKIDLQAIALDAL